MQIDKFPSEATYAQAIRATTATAMHANDKPAANILSHFMR
jgi:hypothetical protein